MLPAGIPDLLQLLVKLTQSMMVERLKFVDELQATVLEVCPFLLHHCLSLASYAHGPYSVHMLSCTSGLPIGVQK